MHHVIRTFVLLWGLLCLHSAQASTYLVTAQSSGQNLNAHIDLYEDTSGQLSIDEVAAADFQSLFQPAAGKAGVGLSPNPWWIRIRLQRAQDAPTNWWLEDNSINIWDLRLYLANANGQWTERRSGERVSFAEGRDLDQRTISFKLPEIGTQQPLTLYLRSYNPAGNLFPLSLWQKHDIEQRINKENLLYGALYGAILALLLYNICLLINLRDKGYFYYVLLTACGLALALCTSGHGFQYLWPNHPVPFWLDRTTLPSLWALLMIQFTMVLLYTHQGLRWTHWIFWPCIFTYIVAIISNALGYRALAALLMSALPIISIPTALFCAIYRCRDFLPARLYLLGYSVVFCSALAMIFRSTGTLPPHPLINFGFPLSIALESLLFAFALAYRIQILRQEKEQALKQASNEKTARMQQMQNYAVELENTVQARTAELASANEQLRTREQELQIAAFHDVLTGLPNRRYLLEHVQLAISQAKRRREALALLVLDVDYFKPINDQYGHDAGDALLCQLAQRLRESIRGHDLVARLGGDEFALLITGPQAEPEACFIAQRLLNAQQPFDYGDTQLQANISIGIAYYPEHAQSFDSLYKAADLALYQAKRQGRAQYEIYSSLTPRDNDEVPALSP